MPACCQVVTTLDNATMQFHSGQIRDASRRANFWTPKRILLVVLTTTTASLIGGWYSKAGCTLGTNGHPLSGCYSDIQYLWSARHLGHHLFPYVHGQYRTAFGFIEIRHGELEYPVVIGVFAWVVGLFAHNGQSFWVANAVGIIPFAAVATWVLYKLVGLRALYVVAAPTLAYYAFINWDVLAVATVVVGVWLWYRRYPYAAAIVLTIGGFTKVWPAFILVPIVLELLWYRRLKAARNLVLTTITTAAVLNVPFMLVNFRGWYAPYAFQSLEQVTTGANSIWYWTFPTLSTASINHLSWALTVLGFIGIAFVSWRRARAEHTFPVLQMSASMVLWFVLVAKVWSPQYDLWLLPFFALLLVPARWWLVFVAIDTWLYVVWFPHPETGALLLLPVFARLLFGALMLLWILFHSTSALPPSEDPAGLVSLHQTPEVGSPA